MPEYIVNVTVIIAASSERHAYYSLDQTLGVRASEPLGYAVPTDGGNTYERASRTRNDNVRYLDAECVGVTDDRAAGMAADD
jgi:hypothetical protein